MKMATKSFGDPEVARALGADFVAVMVDRDGRPDLAEAYARAPERSLYF